MTRGKNRRRIDSYKTFPNRTPKPRARAPLGGNATIHATRRAPIRRYLVVHRALLRELGVSDEPLPEDMGWLADHTSARERVAGQVEYLADEICLAWLLERELFERGWEKPWPGEIIGVIGSGLFVRFGEVFEGYLPARRLPGDYFELNATGTAMAGRRGGGVFRLGPTVSDATAFAIDPDALHGPLRPPR